MILPWNIRIAEESFKSVPMAYREASFALGASQWQTVRRAVLFAALPGKLRAFLLGVGSYGRNSRCTVHCRLNRWNTPHSCTFVISKDGANTNTDSVCLSMQRLLPINANVMGTVNNLSFHIQSLLFAGASVLIDVSRNLYCWVICKKLFN